MQSFHLVAAGLYGGRNERTDLVDLRCFDAQGIGHGVADNFRLPVGRRRAGSLAPDRADDKSAGADLLVDKAGTLQGVENLFRPGTVLLHRRPGNLVPTDDRQDEIGPVSRNLQLRRPLNSYGRQLGKTEDRNKKEEGQQVEDSWHKAIPAS